MTEQTHTSQTTETIKAASEKVKDASEKAVEASQEAALEAKQAAKQAVEATADTAKEVAHETAVVLEQGTNRTLEFFGFTVDVNTLIANGIDLSIKVLLALIVFFVGKWIGKRLVNMAKRVMMRSRMDDTVATFVGNLLYGLMFVAVILAALNKLGINTNSFVAILGGAAVAIGVSLKDQLSNLAAGVMIVLFRPFGRGDTVEVGGYVGTVIDITLVNTRIRTADNHEVIIPNGDITTSASTNFSSLPTRRVPITVGIGYGADIKHAKEIMLTIATQHEAALQIPEPVVRVTALAESSVDLTLYVWAQNNDWFGLQCDLLEQIKYAFDEAGVEIPFPNRTVQIEGLEKVSALLDGKEKLDGK